jgi:CO/xanthine dehydrogenase Mo-binding subunit
MSEVQLVSRRGFLGSMFSAGALVLAAPAAAQDSESAWYPSVYLGIEPTGTVIIAAHRSEMGTGIRTALPMVAADELDADWKRVMVEQAIGDPQYGDQNTDGSKSIRDFYDALRQAGATGRLMLEHAAAATWGVSVSQCQAFNHQIIHVPSGRSLDYGELATLAAQQPVPQKEELRFKSPDEFRYIGIGVPIVDLDAICMGKATYGLDAQMPGMVYASIARSPVLGGTLKSYDDQATRQVRGVQQTVVIPPAKPPYAFQALGGVAVIADSTWAAMQNPQAVQDTVASALGIDKKNVICHVTLLGGGFGRKSKPDYVAEAAILSKQVGKPVKVAWSREDDIHFDYYHTVAAMYMKAATDARGRPTAWLQRSVFPPINSTFDASARYGADGELAQGWVDLPFDIPNIRAENGPAQNHVRIGWLRSVANIYHGFAIQSFIDELAVAAGRDRIEYFLDVLGRPRKIDYKAEGATNAN